MSDTPLGRIIIDEALQARVTLDDATVADCLRIASEAAEDGQPWPFPPIQLVGGYLVDGWHRLEVAKRLGRESIPADEHPGNAKEDCILAAVSANASHGLPRSNADKRRVVELALKTWPNKSSRKIAKACKVSHTFVDRIRTPEPESEVATLPPCEQVPEQVAPTPIIKASSPPLDDPKKHAQKAVAALEAAIRHAGDYKNAMGDNTPKDYQQFRGGLKKIWNIARGWRHATRSTIGSEGRANG